MYEWPKCPHKAYYFFNFSVKLCLQLLLGPNKIKTGGKGFGLGQRI